MGSKFQLTTSFPPPEGGSPDLLIIAGEHSGDEHAALIVKDLKAKYPDLKVACLGGEELKAAGAQLLYDMTAVSVVGFVEVLRHYSFFKSLFDQTLDWIEQYGPKHICFVDYPGFNLRLAAALKERGLSLKGGGAIGLSYYIGPQVWAWKAKRRFKMAETLNRLGVIFPFEVACFDDTTLPVEFVGHPFIREEFEAPFTYCRDAPVALLPGSRKGAVSRILPVLLEGFREVRKRHADLRATIVYPGSAIRELVESILEGYPDLEGQVELVPNTTKPIAASAVLMSSGTMSLACALSEIPGAIVYRLNPLSYYLAKVLVDIPYIGISNLLLEKPLHPEFIQGAARPKSLAAELERALTDLDAVEAVQAGASTIKTMLQSKDGLSATNWLEAALELEEIS
jgi:lipid-A-disaccharide synthase